jgi:hypothetical protein
MSALDGRTRDISGNIDGAVKALSAQLDALLDVSKLVPAPPSGEPGAARVRDFYSTVMVILSDITGFS